MTAPVIAPAPPGSAASLVSRVATWVVTGVLGAATAREVAHSLSWRLMHDAPLMHYIAVQMLHGAVPYRDIVDMNMPGAYWLHESLIAAFGTGDTAWRCFDLAYLAAICAASATIMRRASGAACALGVVLLAAWHLNAGPYNVGQRDFFAVLPLIIAASASVRFIETRRRVDLLVAGATIGVATLLKSTAVLAPALLVPALLAVKPREPSVLIRDALTLGAAMLAVLFAAATVLAWEGALGPFVAAWRDFILPIYAKLRRTIEPSPLVSAIQIGARLSPCLLLITGAGWIRTRVVATRHVHPILAALVGWGLLSFFLQGKGWFYHSYPFAMFTIVWGAVALGELIRVERGARACLVALLACLTLIAVLDFGGLVAPADPPQVLLADQIADDLAPTLKPGDTVQTLDTTYGAIHALLRLGVRQPTRFIYDFPLLAGSDTAFRRAARAEYLGALRAAPPRAIVITDQQWPESFPGYQLVSAWPEFVAFLDASYTLAQQRYQPSGVGYRVYVRN